MKRTIEHVDDQLKVIHFWERSKKNWFSKNPAFDQTFRKNFSEIYQKAKRGELKNWETTTEGSLALLILLDQYPRNAFRGSARMYDTDSQALRIARQMVGTKMIDQVPDQLRIICLLPFAHSEDIQDHEISISLHKCYLPMNLTCAYRHRNIIERFGRFPHRNQLLSRASRPEENRFLHEGGFQG